MAMFHRNKKVLQQISFWGILLLAFTAEGWMDLLCRMFFRL